MAGLALAWALSLPELTAVVVGPGQADHLAPAFEALEIDLSAIDRDHLTEVFS
jgi:aryl-alcohol dehydrogenase-like predicted oxidoreductase